MNKGVNEMNIQVNPKSFVVQFRGMQTCESRVVSSIPCSLEKTVSMMDFLMLCSLAPFSLDCPSI